MTTNITESQVTKYSSDDDIVLSVQGVSKKFCRSLKRSLFYGVQDIASELVGVRKDNNQLRKEEFWALQDVSFELKRGESLGLVGANGSGKTTLLRIISGLIKPDTGSIKITGRVAPLIALGAGFNPILTGRENIYINMSILGLSKAEIDERFNEVVDFAEIGDAIDAPVQTYSSGMAARLGFACAIHTEPDILLIDEVLAVGDINFRAKCHRKLQALRKRNISFILVSHQSQMIINVCKSSIYLSQGRLITAGETSFVINEYEKTLFARETETNSGVMLKQAKPEHESLGLDIISLFFRDEKENILEFPVSGQHNMLCVQCKVRKQLQNINLYIVVRETLGEGDMILHLSTFFDNKPLELNTKECEIRVDMPHLGLKPSYYTINIFLKKGSLYVIDLVENFKFKVIGEGNSRNLYYQPRQWKVINK